MTERMGMDLRHFQSSQHRSINFDLDLESNHPKICFISLKGLYTTLQVVTKMKPCFPTSNPSKGAKKVFLYDLKCWSLPEPADAKKTIHILHSTHSAGINACSSPSRNRSGILFRSLNAYNPLDTLPRKNSCAIQSPFVRSAPNRSQPS